MDKSAPSKESLERARKFLDEQLELRSPMHSWLESLALEFDTIRRERDEVAEKLERELEKAEGQLDIILRECQGDDDASLANDYGGTGWEKEVPVATVRWHRNRWKMSNEAAEKLAEALREWHNPIDCRIGPNCSACKALAAYRERMGRIAAWKEKYQ